MKKLIILALMVGSSLLATTKEINVEKNVVFQEYTGCDNSLIPVEEPCSKPSGTCIVWYVQTTCETYTLDFGTIPPTRRRTNTTTDGLSA